MPISIISGMVFSILYVAAFIALFVFVFLKLQKNPFNIAIFAFLTSRFAQTTQSGFTDFIYNFQFLLVFFWFWPLILFLQKFGINTLVRGYQEGRRKNYPSRRNPHDTIVYHLH